MPALLSHSNLKKHVKKLRTKASHSHHGDDRDHLVQVTTLVRCTYSRGREACLHLVVGGVIAKEQNLPTILRGLTDVIIHVIITVIHIGDGSCRVGRIVIVRGQCCCTTIDTASRKCRWGSYNPIRSKILIIRGSRFDWFQ